MNWSSFDEPQGVWKYQTCQPLVKENLETHEKNLETLQKIVRFFFLPDQTPLSRELDTSLIPLLK